MPETASRGSSTSNPLPCNESSPARPAESAAFAVAGEPPAPGTGPHPRTVRPAALPHRVHSRIGVGLAGGFYPAPHRYELYLSAGCPRSLRISITLDLLGLRDSVATTILTHPAETSDAFASLRRAYEATVHHYDGPVTAPALCDRWSGRIVSNHTPDILRDLTGLLAGASAACLPTLRPAALAQDIDALRDLVDRHLTASAPAADRSAALELLDRQLACGPYLLGDRLTAADVDAWVALTRLVPAEALCARPRLREYVHRLGEHPAFRGADAGTRAAA
ncbi:glutathione S-transferase C-terminal domain-containing protein [Streptomyces sp. NPDC007084]|uniref:glutathione S-transferase C-terminal domain-containing protein n=1 Tax=Streptomyces sp. NPDC007084 TaxID=3154313 RepID=UPI0034535AEC